MCVSLKTKTQNCMWHYRSVHGPGISGVPRRSGSWRTASGKSRMKIFFPGFFPNIFPDFFRILTIIILSCQNMNKQKICHKFFPVKKPQKTKTILLLCYITYLPIANCSKNWMKKEKKGVCFDFFVMLRRVISWSAIYTFRLIAQCFIKWKGEK